MRTGCCALVSLALAVCGCTVGSEEANHVPVAEGGWVSLFDGQTLDGWRVACEPEDRGKELWLVRDGAITADSRGQGDHDYLWLLTDREYGNFELDLKVKAFPDSEGNSGIQIRSRYDEAAGWLDGPQVDLHPAEPFRVGLIYDETRGVQRWIFPSLEDWKIDPSDAPHAWTWNANAGDGWNEIRILCRGTNIMTIVNHQVVTDHDFAGILDDETHRTRNVGLHGHIGLQNHRGAQLHLQFNDIRIKSLD